MVATLEAPPEALAEPAPVALSPLADYFTLTATTAQMRPETPIEECEVALAEIEVRKDATYWWIGDTLNRAEDLYGTAWAQLVPEGKETQYRQFMWVAKNTHPEIRTEAIPFTWYRDAASLPEETAIELIQSATDENGARVLSHTQWQTAVAEAKNTLPKETRGRKARDWQAAIDYCTNRIGEQWTTRDAEQVRELIG